MEIKKLEAYRVEVSPNDFCHLRLECKGNRPSSIPFLWYQATPTGFRLCGDEQIELEKEFLDVQKQQALAEAATGETI